MGSLRERKKAARRTSYDAGGLERRGDLILRATDNAHAAQFLRADALDEWTCCGKWEQEKCRENETNYNHGNPFL